MTKKKNILKSHVLKNVISAVVVTFLGFFLLNLAFTFDFLIQTLVIFLMKELLHHDPTMETFWFPQTMHVLFIFIITYISYLIFGSKLGIIFKSAYSAIPIALVFATIGIAFYPWPLFVYFLSIIFFAAIFYYFKKTKAHWLYYYSLIYVSAGFLLLSLTGTDI